MVDVLTETLTCNNCGTELGKMFFLAGKGKHRMRQNMLSHVLNNSFMFCPNDGKCAYDFYKREFGVEIMITHKGEKE